MATKEMPSGAMTALITPFLGNGEPDYVGSKRNIRFQIGQGICGVLPMGTTGESCTLTKEQHDEIFRVIADEVKDKVFVLAGCGSNSTEETMHYCQTAQDAQCDGALLVDCYYNGPSSLELRREYYEPIAKAFPGLIIVPYIVPGRTGCELAAEDLILLNLECPNVLAVKEATGDLNRMAYTRELIDSELSGRNFKIFSGDDYMTMKIMTDINILASGVISVVSNIAPAVVQNMCQAVENGDLPKARKLMLALSPLFRLVSFISEREIRFPSGRVAAVKDKFRNPLPVKTMMSALGMPAGSCKRPLGKMTEAGLDQIRAALKFVWENNPEILEPIKEFYGVDLGDRIYNDKVWKELAY